MSEGSTRSGHGPKATPRARKSPSTSGVPRSGNVCSPRRELQMVLAASEFWTASAMQDAQPYPLPEIPAERQRHEFAVTAGTGEEGLVAGQPPEQDDDEGELEGFETAATKGGYDYPPPYTRYQLPKAFYSEYPWITVGKVFFKQYGTPYVASASSIGNCAIWTAGHVVHAGDGKEEGWSTDMVLRPGIPGWGNSVREVDRLVHANPQAMV